MEIKEVFARNLLALCAKRREPVNVTAQAIGISRTQLDRYLNGDHLPNDLNLKKISTFFGISEVVLYSTNTASPDDHPGLVDPACRSIAWELFGASSTAFAEGNYQTFFTLASDANQIMMSLTMVRQRTGKTAFRRLTRFASGGRYQGDHQGFVVDRLDGYYFTGFNKVGAREPSLTLIRKLPVEDTLFGGRSLVMSERGPVVCAALMRPIAQGLSLKDSLKQIGVIKIGSPLITSLEVQFLRSLLRFEA